MTHRYRLVLYDLLGNNACDLFDSDTEYEGQAYDIEIKKELTGWKEISFSLNKYYGNKVHNFRWDYIKNEYILYVYEDDDIDCYFIKEPEELHSSKTISVTVTCNHVSEELKTKNLYKYFDDTNGIDTCNTLLMRALGGSGWTLKECDTMYEADGTTEKIRSYSCDSKTGAYKMVSEICELFNARPIFDGYNKTVTVHHKRNSDGWMEILYGKNTDKIKRKKDSSSLVTRLYVEGEYGDYGYVGIDDVNPTGLPFILNFDYYKELGVYKEDDGRSRDTHGYKTNQYLNSYKYYSDKIKSNTAHALESQSELYTIAYANGYIYIPVSGSKLDMTNRITWGTCADKLIFETGTQIALVKTNGEYVYQEYSPTMIFYGYDHAVYFEPVHVGTLGEQEELITVYSDSIIDLAKKANKYAQKKEFEIRLDENDTVTQLLTVYNKYDLSTVTANNVISGQSNEWKDENIISYVNQIGGTQNALNVSKSKRNQQMDRAIKLIKIIKNYQDIINNYQNTLIDIDNQYADFMGFMLRDGYWSDEKYTVGQEESLYKDALDISKELAFPLIEYDIDVWDLSVFPQYKGEEFKLSQTVHIYDDELGINDAVYVDELKIYPDNPKKNTVGLTNDMLNIANKSFSSVIERITEVAKMVKENQDIYKRAVAITKDGKIKGSILEGAVDVLTAKLNSVSSNWTTDNRGNIVFTSVDGSSAMMLSGAGFMIASSKNDQGQWNWRTFGTGDGFTADMIVTGYMSADRIEAGSITTNQLSSQVGANLNISSNQAIKAIVTEDKTSGELRLNQSIIEATKDAITSTVMSSDAMSTVEQTANKINWLVNSGSTSSSISLTNGAIEAVSNAIKIKADTVLEIAAGSLKIKNVEVLYLRYYSATDAPTQMEGWSNSISGTYDRNRPYLWTKTKTTIGNDENKQSIVYSKPVLITGTIGISIESIVPQYCLHDSDTSMPSDDAIWSLTSPDWEPEHYIWTRSKITWNMKIKDNSNITYTPPVLSNGVNFANERAEDAFNTIASVNSELTDANQQIQNDLLKLQTATSTVSSTLDGVQGTISNMAVNLEKHTGMISTLSAAQQTLTAVVDTYQTYFVADINGLHISKKGSNYSTLVDDTGFFIEQEGTKIGGFAKHSLVAENIKAGDPTKNGGTIAMKAAPDGGVVFVYSV